MGDSVTAGIREGVTAPQTYSALLQAALAEAGSATTVLAQGIGGEDTNAALLRLPQIISQSPQMVTLMYGINDSCVPPGETECPVPLDRYRENLSELVARIQSASISPLLMTPNPMAASGLTKELYAGREPYLTQGINCDLARYTEAVRELGAALQVPVLDVYAAFEKRASTDVDMAKLLTDGMHPNPAGHSIIASLLSGYLRTTGQ